MCLNYELELNYTRESILLALNNTLLLMAYDRGIDIGIGETASFLDQMRPVIIALRSVVNSNWTVVGVLMVVAVLTNYSIIIRHLNKQS